MRPICEWKDTKPIEPGTKPPGALEQQFQSNPANVQLGVQLADLHPVAATDAAVAILIVAGGTRDAAALLQVAHLTPNWASVRSSIW